MVIAYLCTAASTETTESAEHSELFWAAVDKLPSLELPAYEVAVERALAES